jgi:hypothetical protein
MALKKQAVSVHGFVKDDSYYRVEQLQIVEKYKIEFRVRASIDGTHPHFVDLPFICNYELSGKNPIAQAYAYLKTLPEFADAEDC